jgi:hypothetical protein
MDINKIPSAHDFLLRVPVYEVFAYSGEQIWEVIDVLYFGGTYDSFCPKCGKESTFQVLAPEKPAIFKRNTARESLLRQHGAAPEFPQIEQNVYRVLAQCSRVKHHLQNYLFLIDYVIVTDNAQKPQLQTTIQKIGQHPSFGDLNIPKLKKYAPVISKPLLGELNRAVGLASHDVGVGAYVYLRRVFESLIEETHEVNKSELDWDENTYQRSRMAEKIVLLKHHLPSFLVDHPEMYSLLSKGIHELSEEDCLSHFETLRIGIELILDEKLERKEKERKIRDAKAALTKAVSSTKA